MRAEAAARSQSPEAGNARPPLLVQSSEAWRTQRVATSAQDDGGWSAPANDTLLRAVRFRCSACISHGSAMEERAGDSLNRENYKACENAAARAAPRARRIER